MIESIEFLRENYFKSILSAPLDTDLSLILPSPLQDNFSSLMRGIIELLRKELSEYQGMYDASSDINTKQDCLNEISGLTKKLDLLIKYFNEAYEENEEVDSNNLCKGGFIFGRNPSGNISFLGDLKRNIPMEYYPTVMELLDGLNDPEVLSNPLKVKKLSNNEKLAGLMEIKAFKVRIIFRKLPNNFIYIMMVRMKKDDNSLKDIDEPYRRSSLLSKDYLNVKNRVKDNIDIHSLGELGDTDLTSIKEYMSSKIGSVMYGA